MKTHTKKKQTNKNKKKKGTLFLCVLLMFRYTYYSCFFFSISSAVFPATLSFFFFITFCRSVLHTSGALLCETCYLFFFFFTWKHAYDLCFFFFLHSEDGLPPFLLLTVHKRMSERLKTSLFVFSLVLFSSPFSRVGMCIRDILAHRFYVTYVYICM